MANRENLPRIISNLTDGNLDTVAPADLGDSILLIGTADRGIDNTPVAVATLQDAIDNFGQSGTLLEGFIEAYYAPGGPKDIRLMRIGNGARGILDLVESLGSKELDETIDATTSTAIPALRVEALYPGAVYNNVSLRMENNNVIGYNPISGLETVIPYDSTGVTTGSVQDVKSLADAINNDANLGSVVVATANRIHTVFEIDVHNDWDYAEVVNGSIKIDLIAALREFDDGDNNWTADNIVDYPDNTGVNAENTGFTLKADMNNSVTAVTIVHTSDVDDVDTQWPTSGYLKIYKSDPSGEEDEVEIVKYSAVVDGAGGVKEVDVTLSDRGFGGTAAIAHASADTTVELYIPIFPTPLAVTAANRIEEMLEVYQLENEIVELDAAGDAEVELPYPVQMASGIARQFLNVDGTEDLDGNGTAQLLLRNSYVGVGDGTETVFEFTAYEAIYNDAEAPADPTDPEEYSTLKVYRTSAAGTTVEVAKTAYTVTSVGGDANDRVAELTFSDPIAQGSIVTVSYDSEPYDLTQLATLYAAQASTSYRDYYAAGDTVTFGTVLPADVRIAYPAKVNYRIGQDAVIAGSQQNEVIISSSAITADSKAIIGLDYYYQPEWVNLSNAAGLAGGTDGITMTNKEKYAALANGYEAIADYSVDIVVPLRTYLDDTKIVYDKETGLPTEVNAGFAAQLNEHLINLQDGVNEAFGIMAVKSANSARLADVNTWYDKLVNISTSDVTRAANVMNSLDARLLDIVAMDLVVANPVTGVPYVSTGEAIMAGLTAKLNPQSATTNKSLGSSVLAMRFALSSRQLNELTGARYVTARLRQGVGIVVTDGVTAAASSSDWTRRTSYRIVAAAMDLVRIVGDPYIGEGFSPAKKAALETALNKALYELQATGAIVSFSFVVKQTPAQFSAGEADIDLVIQPAFELRKIATTVALSSTTVGA